MIRALALAAAAASPLSASAQTHDADYATIPNRVAILQGLDKVTAIVTPIEAPLEEVVSFGALDIVVRACQERPPEVFPESAAYLEIFERKAGDPTAPSELRFDGWMFASSPALSALEHPVYDVWVVDCREPIAED